MMTFKSEKYGFIFIFLSFICLLGCSSTLQIKNDQTSYDSLNEELAGEKCKIILADSGFVFAEDIVISEDSTYIYKVLYSSGRWHTVDAIRTSTSNVRSVTYTDNGVGALKGLGVGLVAGLIVAALTPGAVEDAREEGGAGKGVAASIGMGMMGLSAPIFGLIGGALIGHTYECIISDPEDYVGMQTQDIDIHNLSDDDELPVTVEFKLVLKKGSGFIIILWQEKKIRLERSEYYYRGTNNQGELFIVVPTYIFELKFHLHSEPGTGLN